MAVATFPEAAARVEGRELQEGWERDDNDEQSQADRHLDIV